jgi:hypothetical protein
MLTGAQRHLLERAARAPGDGFDGAGVWGPTVNVARRLAWLGLLKFEGLGQVEDGPDDGEHAIYSITPAGRSAMTGREETGT